MTKARCRMAGCDDVVATGLCARACLFDGGLSGTTNAVVRFGVVYVGLAVSSAIAWADRGTTKFTPITPFLDHATQPCPLMQCSNATSKYDPAKMFIGTEIRQPSDDMSVAHPRHSGTVEPLTITVRKMGCRGGTRSSTIEHLWTAFDMGQT